MADLVLEVVQADVILVLEVHLDDIENPTEIEDEDTLPAALALDPTLLAQDLKARLLLVQDLIADLDLTVREALDLKVLEREANLMRKKRMEGKRGEARR